MATHDYVIANASGAAVRQDINNALAAIVSNNSSANEPGTTYAFQFWFDTTNNILKIRNAANSAWIDWITTTATVLLPDGAVGTPSLTFASETDTGLYRIAANTLGIATSGTERVEISDTGIIINEGGAAAIDVRIEGDSDANLVFIDAGNDQVLVGTSTAFGGNNEKLQIARSGGGAIALLRNDTSVSSDNELGAISWYGNDSTASTHQECATIRAFADGDHADGDKPTRLVLSTAADGASSPTERMRIDSSGNVGIGTSSPTSYANSQTTLVIEDDTNPAICWSDTGQTRDWWAVANGSNLSFNYADGGGSGSASNVTNVLSMDDSGRVLIGTSSNFHRGNLQVIDNGGGELFIGRSDTTVENDNDLGHIFFGSNDTDTTAGEYASITCDADEDHATGSAATRLEFAVTPSGSTGPTEAMRIRNDGTLLVGTTAASMITNTSGGGCALDNGGINASADGNNVFNFNRSNGDGTIGSFRSQGNSEGSVSISGSTCSFNGGHLSRWSQLADGATRTEILRGSVLSNLDEMCVWSHAAVPDVLYTAEDVLPEGAEIGDVKTAGRAAYTEDNEQLNRMKVSDVEGDPNVAGVFQCWDDGDDEGFTDDFFCAMTGDFVIRIAQGTTVARGDLLMSAGDGTAKPQDDDIIRSKTIAKVTSTVVSTTHADGSYCVPCVLMAC